MIKKLLTTIAILLICTQPAWAAGQGVKVSPVSFDLTGSPGQKIEEIVRVSNPTDHDIGVVTEVTDFAPQGEEGGVVTLENYQYGLSKYISIFPKSFSLAPAELQYVTVTVDIPKDAPAGARSGAVLFAASGTAPAGSGSSISGEVGALFVLNVVGDAKDQARLVSFAAPGVATSTVGFDTRVANTGVTVAKFSGVVRVYNVLGSQVAEINLGPSNILPGATRHFTGSWGERNPVGFYRAELSGSFGETKLTSTVYFVGAAPQEVGPLLVLLAALLIFYIRKKRA